MILFSNPLYKGLERKIMDFERCSSQALPRLIRKQFINEHTEWFAAYDPKIHAQIY